jgi:hypothetical protein
MNRTHNPSRLFTVRIWCSGTGTDQRWHGKVQALPSGEAYYFRDWVTLIQLLTTLLTQERPPEFALLLPEANDPP